MRLITATTNIYSKNAAKLFLRTVYRHWISVNELRLMFVEFDIAMITQICLLGQCYIHFPVRKFLSTISCWYLDTKYNDVLFDVYYNSFLITLSSVRGCPKRGVLSPLLWTLLNLTQSESIYMEGYADDIVIGVRESLKIRSWK